ncbi:MAG: glycine oxidase ThiO [Kiritimatiellae bacterium]|nr:glycine oxidase ThiO [Kiritimatiellia bacterium]
MSTAGIVGAGIAGRLLALDLLERGWKVSLFDRGDEKGFHSCTYASAGMLAPFCELETAEKEIATLGEASLIRWKRWPDRWGSTVSFRQQGSLVVTHPHDQHELLRFKKIIESKGCNPDILKEVSSLDIAELEPMLSDRFGSGLFFPREAHIDNREVLNALTNVLKKNNVQWFSHTEVVKIDAHTVQTPSNCYTYDWVVDCRGLGAKEDMEDLRGVRGELLYVHAPDVTFSRPIRLMHPRYPLYIVPRANHVFLIGATTIESEDYNPITVRSTLELLSAAYTLHPGFAEAHILETCTQCRPAFPDNQPRITVRDGLMRINGLYRHGFLLSPILSHFACEYLEQGRVVTEAIAIIRDAA